MCNFLELQALTFYHFLYRFIFHTLFDDVYFPVNSALLFDIFVLSLNQEVKTEKAMQASCFVFICNH